MLNIPFNPQHKGKKIVSQRLSPTSKFPNNHIKHYSRESSTHPAVLAPFYSSSIHILESEHGQGSLTAGADFEDDGNAVLYQTLNQQPLQSRGKTTLDPKKTVIGFNLSPGDKINHNTDEPVPHQYKRFLRYLPENHSTRKSLPKASPLSIFENQQLLHSL